MACNLVYKRTGLSVQYKTYRAATNRALLSNVIFDHRSSTLFSFLKQRYHIDLAGLELVAHVSVSRVLRLQVCATKLSQTENS